jgi:hypothetical protein
MRDIKELQLCSKQQQQQQAARGDKASETMRNISILQQLERQQASKVIVDSTGSSEPW